MKHFNLLTLLVAFTLFFAGCKDKDPVQPSFDAMIIDKNWKVTAATTQSGNSAPVDEYALYDACEKDDITRFTADKNYVETEGATNCDPSGPANEEIDRGTWEINGTKLIRTSASFPIPIPVDLVELTTTTLKLKLTQTNQQGTTTSTVTYTAQ